MADSLNYHLLNGDALKEQFPSEFDQDYTIVVREGLVDGPVKGSNLDEFFQTRAEYLAQEYGGTEHEYFNGVADEIRKVLNIDNNGEVNLWFEDDLFCQVNLWFTVHLLCEHTKAERLFLVRPPEHTPYGFGGLNTANLVTAYKNRSPLEKLDILKQLWPEYQSGDNHQLKKLASILEVPYPFIGAAVNAHIDRIPTAEDIGRPKRTLLKIMDDLGTTEFGPIFKAFCERESIYGFGDLQVKKLLDEILKDHQP